MQLPRGALSGPPLIVQLGIAVQMLKRAAIERRGRIKDMRAFQPDNVDWPSFFFALLFDSLIVWAPAVAVFFLAPEFPAPLLLTLVFAGLVVNAIFYARGATLGTTICGFRLLKQRRERPGLRWGLVLSMLTLGSLPVIVVLAGGNIILSNSSDWLGDPNRYPLCGERIRRRRFLEAADGYWERWAE